jgi:hypothetical protein
MLDKSRNYPRWHTRKARVRAPKSITDLDSSAHNKSAMEERTQGGVAMVDRQPRKPRQDGRGAGERLLVFIYLFERWMEP